MARYGFTHGHLTGYRMSRTYKSWDRMIQRCTNPKSNKFHLYGAKGITVCERWKTFKNFLEDMGERPAGTSLNRKDNSLGYFKDNCDWATTVEQGRNRCTNVVLEYQGKRMCISQWAEYAGLSDDCLRQRLQRHTLGEALSMPKRAYRRLQPPQEPHADT